MAVFDIMILGKILTCYFHHFCKQRKRHEYITLYARIKNVLHAEESLNLRYKPVLWRIKDQPY